MGLRDSRCQLDISQENQHLVTHDIEASLPQNHTWNCHLGRVLLSIPIILIEFHYYLYKLKADMNLKVPGKKNLSLVATNSVCQHLDGLPITINNLIISFSIQLHLCTLSLINLIWNYNYIIFFLFNSQKF